MIIVSSFGKMSYNHVLRRVKTDPDLKNPEDVSRIQRNEKGDLMLELKKGLRKANPIVSAAKYSKAPDHYTVRSLLRQKFAVP